MLPAAGAGGAVHLRGAGAAPRWARPFAPSRSNGPWRAPPCVPTSRRPSSYTRRRPSCGSRRPTGTGSCSASAGCGASARLSAAGASAARPGSPATCVLFSSGSIHRNRAVTMLRRLLPGRSLNLDSDTDGQLHRDLLVWRNPLALPQLWRLKGFNFGVTVTVVSPIACTALAYHWFHLLPPQSALA